MTPSPTRPIFSRNASARRTKLLAASALASAFVGGVAAMLAQPALAQTLPAIPGGASITISTGGSAPAITAPNANTLEIDLNAPRTVINWASLHVSGADAMNFHFDANSDIVLNKTTSQILIDAGGTVTGKVGAATGGNIWFYSPQGVIVSPGAVMTAGGFLFSRGSGINDVSFVDAADPLANLRAASDALIRMTTISSATSASINSSGDVVLSASSGALNVSIAAGATVDVSTTSGSITVGEATASSGTAEVNAGGPGATVTAITGATGVTVSSGANTSVGSATTTTSGDVVLTSGGSVSLTLGNSARDVALSGDAVFTSTIDAVRDVFITGTTGGATVTNRIFAGDDIEVTAIGDVSAGGATLRSTGLGASGDAHVLARSTTGSVTVNAAQTLGTGAAAGDVIVSAATTASLTALSASSSSSRDLSVSGVTASLNNGTAARDVFVSATTGDATVVTQALAGDDVEVTTVSGNVLASAATLRSTGLNTSGSDGHVLARSNTGSVNVGAATSQGTGLSAGNVTIDAGTTATLGLGNSSRDLFVDGVSASLVNGTATRDLFVTATTGGATVTTSATAGDDVEITATTGAVAAGGATLRSTGVGATDDAHVLARSTGGAVTVDTALTQGTGVAAGDVTLSAATTATLTTGDASRDLRIGGVTASLDDGVAARDLFVTTTTGGATVVTLAQAGDDVEVTATTGDIAASAATLRSTGLGATDDAHVLIRSTGGGVGFGVAITEGTGVAAGDVTVESLDPTVGDTVDSTRDVIVTAPFGIDLVSATAAGDITLFATVGNAILGKAVLTGSGAGHDLMVKADGVATLGAIDEASIGAANTFSRTGGNTGTAVIWSLTDDAHVYLDTADMIDTVQGRGVDIVVNTGPATFGAITASNASLAAAALDGSLTVGTASAALGDLDLYAFGGDLTITGSTNAGGQTHIETDGLLDGTSASVLASTGGLDLWGGDVDVGHVTSQGLIEVTAATGDGAVQSAQGDVIQVGASGDVFVDAAEAVQAAIVVGLGDVLVNSVKVTDPAGYVIVHGDGDATVRAAEAPDGILVDAGNKATFGADDETSITAANYLVTNAGCGCGAGGLQVTSSLGDAVVYIDTASNGIGVVGASQTGSAIVVQKTGDLLIDEVAGYNITLKAASGTLETGLTTIADGDYTITAHDFLGDALTPTLFNGLVRDVTITDTLGGLSLGALAIHADRRLTIAATNGGAVTGAAQLSAGSGLADGQVTVTGAAIAIDTASSDGLVNLDGGVGLVDVATSVSVDGNYTLKGGDFSTNALTPLGLKAGLWSITDRAGGFDFTGKTLHYGGALALFVNGVVNGGDITVDTDTISVDVQSGHLGALSAGGVSIAVNSTVGGVDVDSAEARSLIRIWASNGGAASLGAATLNGAGTNQLIVKAFNGDAVLGAATVGAVTAANFVSSAGATTTVDVTAPAGKVDINLDHTTNAKLTTVSALNDVKIKVVNGSQAIGAVTSTNGAVTINGPTGSLIVDQLTAHSTSRINGIGDTRLVSADADAQLTVQSLVGALRLGDGTPGRLIDVGGGLTLQAFTDIVQEQGALKANTLSVLARSGATLLGDNLIPNLNVVTVSAGDFTYHGAGNFTLQDVVNVRAGTVDLRSDGAIVQNLGGVILTQKLTGSSVGGANFRAANEVVELGDFTNTGGLLNLVNSRSLTLNGTVLSTGTVSVASHGGMTFAGTGTVRANGTGDAVVLASDGVFTNGRGADAVTAANGRWLIYTQAAGAPLGSTAGNTFNGLVGKSLYGSVYNFAAGAFGAPVNAGDRFVYAYQPTMTVAPDSRIVTYNGAVPTTSATVTGLVNGDLFTDAWTGALVINGATSKNVGTYVLTADVSGLTSDLNYAFAAGPAGSLRIDPKALSAVLDADDKTYDRTTTATGAVLLTGVVTGDAVTAAGAYAFGDRNAGAGKTVTASGVSLAGADAGNYSLASVGAGSANILKKSLAGALTANGKTYDGSAAATGSIGLTGVVAGDTVTAAGTYAFADRNAGAGKTVTVSGAALAGLDAGNYSLGGVSAGLADILRRQVTVAADSAFKPFGQIDPPLTYRVTVGSVVAGDAFAGGPTRAVGEVAGDYGITRGTLALSANYDVTFTGAVFTIRPLPSNAPGGSPSLKHLNQSPDFSLDWDPETYLTTEGQACPGGSCPPQAAVSGGGAAMAAMR